MTEFSDAKPMGLYEAAIGEKNQGYYVAKFEDFDRRGPGLHAIDPARFIAESRCRST